MACHLAGVTTAVATCGTAFGTEHVVGHPPAADGLRRVHRRGDLHLRRRRGRHEGGRAGLRRRPEVHGADVRRDRAERAWIPCELRQKSGDTAVLRSGRRAGSRWSSSCCAPPSAASTSTPPRGAAPRSTAASRWSPRSRTTSLRDEYARRLGRPGRRRRSDAGRGTGCAGWSARATARRGGGRPPQPARARGRRRRSSRSSARCSRSRCSCRPSPGRSSTRSTPEAFLVAAHRALRAAIAAAGGTSAGGGRSGVDGGDRGAAARRAVAVGRARAGGRAAAHPAPIDQERYADAVLARHARDRGRPADRGAEVAGCSGSTRRSSPTSTPRLFGELHRAREAPPRPARAGDRRP